MRWEEHVEMFGKSQTEFDIMNEVAPGFFKSVQDMSWETTLLHLCRFADPAKVSSKRTLSLDALLTMRSSQQVPELGNLVSAARSKIKFAQDWRNRSIAHADLEHALDSSAKPLAPASRAHVREALAAIVAVLEAIDRHFTGITLGFGGTGWNWGGTHLLSELRLVAQLREERSERMNSGNATADDLDYKKWL
jgi:AbiU2